MKTAITKLIYWLITPLKRRAFSSAAYWTNRYANGGNSGAGSYNHLAEFKAEILNDFVEEKSINGVLELGCGDGNQLSLARYPSYTGYDVSDRAILTCRAKFHEDSTKRFYLVEEYDGRKADLSISLDVIFHLVEDDAFENYMHQLFGSAERYVAIYSSDFDEHPDRRSPHVRHRNFTAWITDNLTNWIQIDRVENRFPYNGDAKNTSFAHFTFYEKV